MSLSHSVINTTVKNEALLEKVILGNDFSSLNSIEKVEYVKNICDSIGLNPLTKPIQLIKFQGREIPYFTKDATEQLRKLNNININKIDTQLLDESLYVVTVYASTHDGRQDSSTGVISITGLKGEALCNAMMKAETKAKRRVTLSICGLGFMDESEAESLFKEPVVNQSKLISKNENIISIEKNTLDKYIELIALSKTADQLIKTYKEGYKIFSSSGDEESLKKIIIEKDKRKDELNLKTEVIFKEKVEV